MAVFSAIKNKRNQKLREGIEDLTAKCGDDTECGHVDVRNKFLNISVQFIATSITRLTLS